MTDCHVLVEPGMTKPKPKLHSSWNNEKNHIFIYLYRAVNIIVIYRYCIVCPFIRLHAVVTFHDFSFELDLLMQSKVHKFFIRRKIEFP